MTDQPYRILVTGWRDWPESHQDVIWRALDNAARDYLTPRPAIVVVHGECPYGGVDLYADRWAQQHPLAVAEPHPAERGPKGQILGPARNSHMVKAGADVCLAFPGPKSKGTWDCVQKAVDADIPVKVFAWSSSWAADWADELDLAD